MIAKQMNIEQLKEAAKTVKDQVELSGFYTMRIRRGHLRIVMQMLKETGGDYTYKNVTGISFRISKRK